MKKNEALKKVAILIDQLGYDTKPMNKQKMILSCGLLTSIAVRYDTLDGANKQNSLGIVAYTHSSSTCDASSDIDSFIKHLNKVGVLHVKLTINDKLSLIELDKKDALELLNTLKELTEYHLFSPEGPLYYIQNTMHHVASRNLALAKLSACWPEATWIVNFIIVE